MADHHAELRDVIIREMAEDITRQGYIVTDARVVEMDEAGTSELVPVEKSILDRVSEGDDKPLFVTINAVIEGKSKNGKVYTRQTINDLAEQINTNKPDGYNGHLTEAEYATKRPDPVTIWLGAVVKEKAGKAHLYVKGYVMPEELKLRSYLRRAKAIGKNVSVSIFARAARAVYNANLKAYDLFDVKLKSIDWSRGGAEGIPNDGTLILASEMEDEGSHHMNREDHIKSATTDELRTLNPDAVASIETAAREADAGKISEMETITGMIGTDKPADVLVREMQEERDNTRRENRELHLNQELASKVRAKSARPILREMVVAEMESAEDPNAVNVAEMVDHVLGSDEGKAVIDTHVDKAPRVNPLNSHREAAAERNFTNIVKRGKRK